MSYSYGLVNVSGVGGQCCGGRVGRAVGRGLGELAWRGGTLLRRKSAVTGRRRFLARGLRLLCRGDGGAEGAAKADEGVGAGRWSRSRRGGSGDEEEGVGAGPGMTDEGSRDEEEGVGAGPRVVTTDEKHPRQENDESERRAYEHCMDVWGAGCVARAVNACFSKRGAVFLFCAGYFACAGSWVYFRNSPNTAESPFGYRGIGEFCGKIRDRDPNGGG